MTMLVTHRSSPRADLSNAVGTAQRERAAAAMTEAPEPAWETTLPPEILRDLLNFRSTSTPVILAGDHSKLAASLSVLEVRNAALNALTVDDDKLLPRGSRIALCAALSNHLSADSAILPLFMLEAVRDPKDRAFLSYVGNLTAGLTDNEIRHLAFCLVPDILPLFTKALSYGQDSWVKPWVNVFSRLGYTKVAPAIEEELHHRAAKGNLSGYAHLIEVVRNFEPAETASVFDRLLRGAAGAPAYDATGAVQRFFSALAKNEKIALMTTFVAVGIGAHFYGIATIDGVLPFLKTRLGYIAVAYPQAWALFKTMYETETSWARGSTKLPESKLTLAMHCVDSLCGELSKIRHVGSLLETVSTDKRADQRLADYLKDKSRTATTP